MNRYHPITEETLNGIAQSNLGYKGIMLRIENSGEFKKLKKGARGIIINDELYMCTTPEVAHIWLLKYLKNNEKIPILQKLMKDGDSVSFGMNMDKFLTVQKGEVHPHLLFGGESQYVDWHKSYIKNYINIAKKLGVILTPHDVFFDREHTFDKEGNMLK